MAQMNISTKNKLYGLGEQNCGCQGEGEGVGWSWSLGIIHANFCIWCGYSVISCCTA